PRLRKSIIYLDQFFLSHAFRERQKDFIKAAARIKNLAHKQLVVSPWSSVHEFETHLWRHSSQADLWKFIKQSARGHKYSNSHRIKSVQIQRAFDSFVKGDEPKLIDPRDSFHRNIHKWDDYYWIDVGRFTDDSERIRKGKEEAIASLVDLFDEWAASKNTLEQDVIEEANGYARTLEQLYMQSIKAFIQGSVHDYLNAPADSNILQVLMLRDSETLSYEERMKRIGAFHYSDSFRSTPNIDISCRLYAVLRQRVRDGQFANREKAKEKLAGIFYDVDAISIYGPYSDAIFIDRSMHEWLKQEGSQIGDKYSFQIFSAKNWEEFYAYLDEIEKNCSEEIRSMLPVVYPPAKLT
ncbi:MAG: hypothetical protein AB1306_12415, partial [Nitrospirota bacterium]